MSMLLHHKLTARQLLTVYPSLYNDLCNYPQPITNLSRCTLPSPQPYFLHPLERQISPYDVPVCQKLKEYVEVCDQHMIDTCPNQVNLRAILKGHRRGDQYGFGDDIDGDLHIMKNMDQKMLVDQDATRI